MEVSSLPHKKIQCGLNVSVFLLCSLPETMATGNDGVPISLLQSCFMHRFFTFLIQYFSSLVPMRSPIVLTFLLPSYVPYLPK
ncbi:hypothetical protein FKM82_021854 [Ascaphus truei]